MEPQNCHPNTSTNTVARGLSNLRATTHSAPLHGWLSATPSHPVSSPVQAYPLYIPVSLFFFLSQASCSIPSMRSRSESECFMIARISPHFTSGFSGRIRISHPDKFGCPQGNCPDFSASHIRIFRTNPDFASGQIRISPR